MDFTCDERLSDSPFVQRIWRSQSDPYQEKPFISMAETHWSMVVTKYRGTFICTVRGPETRATPACGPAGAEYVGIMFRAGTFMPDLPAGKLMDRADVNLPGAADKTFWLKGAAWQFPDFENADTFVDRLAHEGLIVCDPVVEAVLLDQPPRDMSLRSLQRRFLKVTGLTCSTVRQIERARYATTLLKQGVPILDVVYQAGYADQPHLTRSLKHYIGQTPAQIICESRPQPLSFLYQTIPY